MNTPAWIALALMITIILARWVVLPVFFQAWSWSREFRFELYQNPIRSRPTLAFERACESTRGGMAVTLGRSSPQKLPPHWILLACAWLIMNQEHRKQFREKQWQFTSAA
jgi:hypothetical protein